jgi:two-component system OmpR family sensor kinase
MSLRLKLLLAMILLVVTGLAVTSVVTYRSIDGFLLGRVDQELTTGYGFVLHACVDRGFGGAGFGTSPVPPGTYGLVTDPSGKVLAGPIYLFSYGSSNPPAPSVPSNAPKSEPFTAGSAGGSSLRYRVLVQDVSVQTSPDATPFAARLVVGVPLTEIDQTLRHLVTIEGLVAGAVLLGLGLLSWWLVHRELRPLEEMGVTAGAIAAGELSLRVPQQDPRTEVGRLGVALNAMLTQIEQAFAERKASEDRLRRFLADASHELRTPLTSIRGYAELFRRGASEREEDLGKSMRRIEEESARMGVMVEDLLLLAKLDESRGLEVEPVDLAAVAADAVADARAAAPDRDITLDAPAPVMVSADQARLHQVAANLLSNAVVHTPASAPVTVRAAVEGDHAVLEVADRGPGLSPDQVGRVFEPFYRSDPSRDRTTGGAGLGLAIVAAIADAHAGRVEVLETPGGGATFRVLIPRDRAQGVDIPPPPADG